MEITVSGILNADEFLEQLAEELADPIHDHLSDRIDEQARDTAREYGEEAGREAGYEAAQEAVAEGDPDAVTFDELYRRMTNEFTGKRYENGCGEWRAYYDAVLWCVEQAMVREGGELTFLQPLRAVPVTAAEVTEHLAGPMEDITASVVSALDQRVKDLELLVAAQADALYPLRDWARTAKRHDWPDWLRDLQAGLTTLV